MTTLQKSRYYPNLDGWRGYAILWILLGHVVFIYSINFSEHLLPLFIGASTYLAVDVFFVISGLVIAENMFMHHGEAVDWKTFVKKRAFRVLPMYFFVVFCVFMVSSLVPNYGFRVHTGTPAEALTAGDMGRALFSWSGEAAPARESSVYVTLHNRGESFWQNILLVQNFYPYSNRVKLLAHTWFIAIIVHFYILFGLVAYGVARLFPDPHLRRNAVLGIVAVLMLAVAVLRAVLGTEYIDYLHMTQFRLDAVLLGCVLSLTNGLPGCREPETAWGRVRRVCWFGVGLALLVPLIFRWPPIDWSRSPNVFIASYLAFGFMIMATREGSGVSRVVFGNPLITWVGRNSYGTYLVHYPLMFFYRLLADRMHWGNAVAITTYCMVSLTAGWALQAMFAMTWKRFSPAPAFQNVMNKG